MRRVRILTEAKPRKIGNSNLQMQHIDLLGKLVDYC